MATRSWLYRPRGKILEAMFEIIAELNRRAILSLLVSSQQSVGEIERQLSMPQPTVSKHLRVLREARSVESTVDAQRRLYRLRPEPLPEGMPGSISSVGSGPLTLHALECPTRSY